MMEKKHSFIVIAHGMTVFAQKDNDSINDKNEKPLGKSEKIFGRTNIYI